MNKVVIVTGSSRGIGASTIRKFAESNYNVVINYLNSQKEAKSLKKEIEEKYPVKALVIKADVGKEDDVKALVKRTIDTFGRIDVLINNAGISIDTIIEDKTVEIFNQVLTTNLLSVFLMCKHVGKIMLDQKGGSIVNISSTNAIDTYYPYGMDYDASKAGVISLTHNFATLYAPYVRVNAIASGWVETDMNKDLDPEFIKEECKHILLDRFAKPEEIAEEIFHLAESTYINNTIIRVDGGHSNV